MQSIALKSPNGFRCAPSFDKYWERRKRAVPDTQNREMNQKLRTLRWIGQEEFMNEKCQRASLHAQKINIKPKWGTDRQIGWEKFMHEERRKQMKPQEQVNAISRICEAALPRQYPKHAFWWNQKTGRLRLESLRAFHTYKQFQRIHGRDKAAEALSEVLFEKFKEARRSKQLAIRKAKAVAWAKLLSEINENDPCVRYFKLLLRRLTPPLVSRIKNDFLQQVIAKLSPQVVFPMRDSTNPEDSKILDDELEMTLNQPIPDEILKRALRLMQGVLGDSTKLFQLCLQRTNFSDIWKLTILILLKKDGIPSVLPMAHRTIPLSNEFESDVLFQIVSHLNNVDKMYMLDSAVNCEGDTCSVPWGSLYRGLKLLGIPEELIYLLGEYLRSCCLVNNMCVVPQQSVLCSLLLTLMHKAMLKPCLPLEV